MFFSTSCSFCCSSSSPLQPSSSTLWTSLMSQGPWKVCGSEMRMPFYPFPRVNHSDLLIRCLYFQYRALLLPSSSPLSCCGCSQCCCPSSFTTRLSSNTTGPGRALKKKNPCFFFKWALHVYGSFHLNYSFFLSPSFSLSPSCSFSLSLLALRYSEQVVIEISM